MTFLLSLFQFPKKIFEIDFKAKFINNLARIFKNIVTGWNLIIKNRKGLISLALLLVADLSIMITTTWIQFKSVGVSLSFVSLVLYAVLTSVIILISFTPGSIGIREAVLLLFSDIIGVTTDEVLQVAVIDRGVLFFVLLLAYLLVRAGVFGDVGFDIFGKREPKKAN